MQGVDLQKRHKAFAIRIIKMVDAMPNTISSMAIARQIVRSGTSPSANYRAACIAKSEKDFINKLTVNCLKKKSDCLATNNYSFSRQRYDFF